tara:strand:- start:6595 stop:10125 length:3531 start_codon:yes stop_codon:yes gene_type:complete
MKLSEIFERPIDRPINSAVVVSNQKKETISAEIEEYVFTDDLIEKLYLFLDTVINKKLGKTGIWINGYYGSGKSHFIKYAHYCLNTDTFEKAFNHYLKNVARYQKDNDFSEVTESNILQLRNRIEQIRIEDIIFNVEDETDDGSGERLTRIFLSMLNRFRGYNSNDIPLAILFEKYLDRKGKFDEFKERLAKESGFNWASEAAEVAAYELDTILTLAKSLVPEMDTESLRAKLSNPETFRITIKDTLIPELSDFLADKDSNYRLVFLVDEISQYIGNNKELLLNFQNIIERVSEDCNNQVWIACTAQQSLEEVSDSVGSADANDEFGKILGRFDTRISLESADASYITQKRVLDKNSVGTRELTSIYQKNEDAIENQFKLHHELYKGFLNIDDFLLSYPYVPYQFKLISHVFESFQGLKFVIKEVKDNERSILSITHYTTQQHKEDPVGEFLPFDAFFNKMFTDNMTQRGRRAIENALGLDYVKANPFAERVVKNLFLISNLKDAIRITFPSNIDNLTVLMMTNLDENKLQLQNKIKEVLDKLLDESIIREEKGNYFFFNEDEMDLTNIIKETVLNNEDRLNQGDYFLRPLLKIENKERYESNDFKVAYELDKKSFLRNGDVSVVVALFDRQTAEQQSMSTSVNQLVICINEWFTNDLQLMKDFEWYCKNVKYFTNNSSSSTGERTKTIEIFRTRNTELGKKLTRKLTEQFHETRFVSGQTIIEADAVNGAKPVDRYKNVINKHIGMVYKHHKLSNGYALTANDLRKVVREKQFTTFNDLTAAEQMVEEYITNMGGVLTVDDIVRHFEAIPFGWKDVAIIHMIVELNRKKKRELEFKNQPRYKAADFIEKALNTNDRTSCVVKEGEEISQSLIDDTLMIYRNIFNVDLPATTDGNRLYDLITEQLAKQFDSVNSYTELYYGKYPFGIHFHNLGSKLDAWIKIRDPKRLFTALQEGESEIKSSVDKCKSLIDFIGRAIQEYRTIQKFYNENKDNFEDLAPEDKPKVDMLDEFFRSDDPAMSFRHVRKAYDELRASLKTLRDSLIGLAVDMYDQVFEDLDRQADAMGVDRNEYGNKEYIQNRIRGLKSITAIRLEISKVSAFHNEQLKQIIDTAHRRKQPEKPVNGKKQEDVVGEPHDFYVTKLAKVIRTESELDAYLARARKEMLALLKDKKTIIIK